MDRKVSDEKKVEKNPEDNYIYSHKYIFAMSQENKYW